MVFDSKIEEPKAELSMARGASMMKNVVVHLYGTERKI